MTVMLTVAVSVPPVLLAVTVYCVVDVIAVGVPEISPLVVENERPAGSDGLIDHAVTGPPLALGVTEDIVTSFVKVRELGV